MTVNNTLGAAEAASPAKALPNASYAALISRRNGSSKWGTSPTWC
jgi:hypothetical protein